MASLFLARRWLGAREVRRSAILLVLVFALTEAVFACVIAFTLSDAQVAGELGTFSQRTADSVVVGDLKPDFVSTARTAVAAVDPGANVFLESTIRPDSFAKTFVQSPLDTVRFIEDPTLTQTFPDRFHLDTGAWPAARDDVVVSKHLFAALPDRTRFTVLSGRATFYVVGVVTDTYATKADIILAGPRTFETIPRADRDHSYAPVEGQVKVFWRNGALKDVAEALSAQLPKLPKGQGSRSDDLKANYFNKSQVRAQAARPQFGENNTVVSSVPLVLVVLVVSALVVGQTRRAYLTNADRLVHLGMRRTPVRLIQTATIVAAAAVSSAVGLGVGWLLAIGLRPTVLKHYATQPLAPIPGIGMRGVAVIAPSLLLIAIGTVWPHRLVEGARRPHGLGRMGGGLAGLGVTVTVAYPWIRRIAALLALATAIQIGALPGSTGHTLATAYLTVAALLLLVPDVLRLLVRALPSTDARTFVARRLMSADIARQAAAATVVACCIAIPICTATQLSSQKRHDNALRYSLIPRHQIWVQNTGGPTGNIADMGRIVAAIPGTGTPVVTRDLSVLNTAGTQETAAARFKLLPDGGSYSTALVVVDSVAALQTVLGRALPEQARTVLNNGGVLDFTGARGAQQLLVSFSSGKRLQISPPLPTLDLSVDQQLHAQFAGAILRRTAQALTLPIGKPTKYIFTGISPQTIGPAVAAVVAAGYDADFVQYTTPPPPATLPVQAYVFLAALVLGGFAILLQVVRGQARTLRSYSSRLVAIGLTPRWTLFVLGIQSAVTLGAGVILGAAGGLLGVDLARTAYPSKDIPVLPITLACTATVVAAGLAVLLAVRTITAVESPEIT